MDNLDNISILSTALKLSDEAHNDNLQGCRAFAVSLLSNPQNLESPWYGFWLHELVDGWAADLVESFKGRSRPGQSPHEHISIAVIPQAAISVTERALKRFLHEQDSSSAEETQDASGGLENLNAEPQAQADVGTPETSQPQRPSNLRPSPRRTTRFGTTSISPTSTQAGANNPPQQAKVYKAPKKLPKKDPIHSLKIPDFGIYLLITVKPPAGHPNHGRGYVELKHFRLPVLVEIKRHDVDDPYGDIPLDAKKLSLAENSLLRQAISYFICFPSETHVYALGAVGQSWSFTKIERSRLLRTALFAKMVPDALFDPKTGSSEYNLKWEVGSFRAGESDSNKARRACVKRVVDSSITSLRSDPPALPRWVD
ncbi:hypothetical protein BC834DRAFT_872289 [Gloeopeniophorella convolvens]|nr:hypothetical protein BC834DRAFT_872289 [Gloeopeniophorella convolvens]